MRSVQQLIVDQELSDLAGIARQQSWDFTRISDEIFLLAIDCRDKRRLYLEVHVDAYPVVPPAWHWRNPLTGALGEASHTPVGGAFFHSNGVICAPWNRLAYAGVDSRGPHADWAIAGDWKSNPHTGSTTTLAAMALRIAHEAMNSYKRRINEPEQ